MSKKQYAIGSERIYRIVKRGATGGKPVAYDADRLTAEIGTATDNRDIDYTLELVKDFDLVEPVTVDDTVRLAKKLLARHNDGCICCDCCLARDILERAGAK